VALLKWVLYDRVLNVLKARQQKIADQFSQAQHREDEASEVVEDYRQKLAKFEEDQEGRLADARNDVEAFRRELMAEARDQATQQEARWSDALEQQQASFARELGRQAATRICDIARQVLRDLASESLEDRITVGFVQRLQQLDEASRVELTRSIANPEGVVAVASAFELSASAREALASALQEMTGRKVKLSFKCDEQMACGIVLRSGSYKIAWCIDEYVNQLTKLVERDVTQETASP
jgi:F-type H+-transporting ATPase subunit b